MHSGHLLRTCSPMEAAHIWLDRQLPEGWLDLQPHGALQPPCNPIHLQYLLTYHLPTQSHVGYSSRSGCNHGRTKETKQPSARF